MAFAVQQDPDERTFRLVGELDLATADELLHHLGSAVKRGGDLRLHLGALRFMDSSGIRVLISVCQELGDRGRMILSSPTGEVAKVLKLIRADTFPNLVIEDGGGA
jgi:anti-anti-sigma factor